MVSMSNLEEIKKAITKTPLISFSAVKLMKIINSEKHSGSDIANIISTDSSLSAKVLKQVNSATYGLKSPCDSIQQAVIMLGKKELYILAIKGCSEAIYQRSLPFYEIKKGDLWKNSLKIAFAAKHLTEYSTQKMDPEISFTGGILCDMGKTALGQFLLNSQDKITEAVKDKTLAFNDIEKKILGIDHTEVGKILSVNWELPESLQNCIEFHHTPNNANEEYRHHAYVIHLADYIATMDNENENPDINSFVFHLAEDYPNFVDIDADGISEIIQKIHADIEKFTSG